MNLFDAVLSHLDDYRLIATLALTAASAGFGLGYVRYRLREAARAAAAQNAPSAPRPVAAPSAPLVPRFAPSGPQHAPTQIIEAKPPSMITPETDPDWWRRLPADPAEPTPVYDADWRIRPADPGEPTPVFDALRLPEADPVADLTITGALDRKRLLAVLRESAARNAGAIR